MLTVDIFAAGKMVEVPLRAAKGHWALDIFRGDGGVVVLCAICGGTWQEGGFPPAECGRDRHVNRRADAST